MANSNRTLYILPAFYPYAKTRDCFLEGEILYLREVFDKIVFIPNYGEDERRSVPDGCEVWEPFFHRQNQSRKNFKYLLNSIGGVKYILLAIKDLSIKKTKLSMDVIRRIISTCLELGYFASSKQFKKLIQDIRFDDVVYFYWGAGLNHLSILLRGKVKMVSRFHGFGDLWEDAHKEYVPLRTQTVKCLDRCVFISRMGEEYFLKRYPYANTETHPLGSFDFGLPVGSYPDDGYMYVLSCSTVYPLKRVDLIFKSINQYTKRKIKWVHIGDGETFYDLKQLIRQEKKDHLEITLLGHKTHDEVMDYLQHNHFDLFINLSTMEGVPVSIMEATSFNIPIIATNVGATSEAVPDSVGVLVSANPSTDEVCNAIDVVMSNTYSPREFWNTHYNAATNYQKFAQMLANL